MSERVTIIGLKKMIFHGHYINNVIFLFYYIVSIKYIEAMQRRKHRDGCTALSAGGECHFVFRSCVIGYITFMLGVQQ